MYSPQFMLQVNQTRPSFINFLMYISEKMSQFDHFQAVIYYFGVCVCVENYNEYFFLQYNFVGRDDINFTCHLKNGSSLANYCLDGKLSSCNRIDFQTDDADSIVSALSISQ